MPETYTYPSGFALKYVYNSRGFMSQVRRLDNDNLLKDRLTYWSATGGSAKTMAYAANGNVLKKTDVSSSSNGYLYETAKPNAVTKVVSPTSSFQQNSLGQTIAYSPSNKVASIYQDVSSPMSGYRTLEITYNAFDQRVYSKYIENLGKTPLLKETFYFDNYEVKKELPNSQTWYHYLQGPDGLFAIMKQQGSTKTMYYVHKDYLGSLTAISDAAGNLVESLSYDPWGRRRNPNDWNDYNVTSTMFDRGFTGHEHLPQFGLINMNGRVYDPFLARFLSPDPFVQAPGNPQNYNRYTYALNNPLKYTDPSGYTFKPDDWDKGFGGALSYTPMQAGYQGNIGPGSSNHWSDGIDATRDWWLMSSATYIYNYGFESWNDLAKSTLRPRSTNGNMADDASVNPANYKTILEWMAAGFNISVVNAFGNSVLVGSFGALGTMRYGEGGGLIFSNKTAGMVKGEAVVGQNVLSAIRFDDPQMKDFSGLIGILNYLWTGGNIDGYHYNINGSPKGLAPSTGMPPSFIGGPLRKGQSALKVGKYLFNPTAFHSVKEGVLTFANPKNFSHIVGSNPDLFFKGGKIWLTGTKTGGYFGKSYETGMTVADFLKLF